MYKYTHKLKSKFKSLYNLKHNIQLMFIFIRMGCPNLSKNNNTGEEKIDEKHSEVLLTVKEAAKAIGESPYVLRNWMRELKTHIPTIQGENGYNYFDEKALERIKLIQEMNRDRGYSIKQIEYHLATNGEYIKPEPMPDASDKLMEEINKLHEKMERQEEFNKLLVQKLEEQSQYIDSSLKKRDQHLLETMKEMQTTKQETAASQESKKGFFSRLFSK